MLYNEKEFKRSKPAGFDGLFNWDFLQGCFPRVTIMPMDFDAVVEIGGRFLVFETKNVGAKMGIGQYRTITSLLTLPQFSVMYIGGKKSDEFAGFCYGANHKKYKYRNDSPDNVTEKIRELVTAWAEKADIRCSLSHEEILETGILLDPEAKWT